jgi:hypothetical protein
MKMKTATIASFYAYAALVTAESAACARDLPNVSIEGTGITTTVTATNGTTFIIKGRATLTCPGETAGFTLEQNGPLSPDGQFVTEFPDPDGTSTYEMVCYKKDGREFTPTNEIKFTIGIGESMTRTSKYVIGDGGYPVIMTDRKKYELSIEERESGALTMNKKGEERLILWKDNKVILGLLAPSGPDKKITPSAPLPKQQP